MTPNEEELIAGIVKVLSVALINYLEQRSKSGGNMEVGLQAVGYAIGLVAKEALEEYKEHTDDDPVNSIQLMLYGLLSGLGLSVEEIEAKEEVLH